MAKTKKKTEDKKEKIAVKTIDNPVFVAGIEITKEGVSVGDDLAKSEKFKRAIETGLIKWL
jgi:hypothetical protein